MLHDLFINEHYSEVDCQILSESLTQEIKNLGGFYKIV